MADFIKKILRRKILAGIIALTLIVGGYFVYKKIFGTGNAIRYITAQVHKGTLIVSISGSGQVSASNQVDLKPKASGDIIYVGVKNGQEVEVGTLIAELDARDAQKAVRDAEVNLTSARLALEKLKKPADELSLLQAENMLAQAKESKQKAEDDLKKAYEDGFNTVANAFLDLPSIMSGLNDMLFTNSLGISSQWNIDYYADAVKSYDLKALQYKNDTSASYQTARQKYDKNFVDYKSVNRFSETNAIESLIDETYNTTKGIAGSVKDANNLIQFYQDKLAEQSLKPQAMAATHLASLNIYTGKTNTLLINLLSITRTIQSSKEAILNAERTISEKTESLSKLKSGPDEFDIKSQELSLKQRENSLLDAEEKLADYFIRAPFSGTIAQLEAKKGDSVSPSTILGTLITKQKIAEISLNEVDIAQIKNGQKVTLTFDAVPTLTISGEVAEVDAIGTVAQGVVTYKMKIAFDTQDERVKTAMSVSAAIITEVKSDVLLVPNSAVKSQGNNRFVEVPAESFQVQSSLNPGGVTLSQPPNRQTVETGVSNDEFTEIISGLKEGDIVVASIINPQTKTASQQQSGGLRIPGVPGGGRGNR